MNTLPNMHTSFALLCADGPVQTLVGLSLTPEYRRGHGALYDAVNHGRMEIGRLRRTLAGLAVPRAADGRLVLGVDVSPWLRPDAATSPAALAFSARASGTAGAGRPPAPTDADAIADNLGLVEQPARIIAMMVAMALESGDETVIATAAYVRGELFLRQRYA